MRHPKTVLIVICGLLFTAASVVMRYQVARQPVDTSRIFVRPLLVGPEIESAAAESQPPEVCEPAAGTSVPDEAVRAVVHTVSAHPDLAAWLVGDELIRRFVQAVNLVAGGYSPRSELDFLAPRAPLVVDNRSGQLFITNGSFRRFDLVTEIFASIDVRGATTVYERLAPALRTAHRENSWYAPEFDEQLIAAIDHLLATPIPDGAIRVERQPLSFSFADPELESLTPAQHQLLRMGPSNARRVQGKLLALRTAIAGPPQTMLARHGDPGPNDPESVQFARYALGAPTAP